MAARNNRALMDDDLRVEGLDVSQAHEFKLALRRSGWKNRDLKRLCEGKMLIELLPVVRGHAKVEVFEYVIDCDATPYCPKGLVVEKHVRGGQLNWGRAKKKLYLSGHQTSDGLINGFGIEKELMGTNVMNGNVLDYLIANPDQIPENWQRQLKATNNFRIFFWGTTYRVLSGGYTVRCLSRYDEKWISDFRGLHYRWDSFSPAAEIAA